MTTIESFISKSLQELIGEWEEANKCVRKEGSSDNDNALHWDSSSDFFSFKFPVRSATAFYPPVDQQLQNGGAVVGSRPAVVAADKQVKHHGLEQRQRTTVCPSVPR